ncbi:phosphoribulokinase [Benzoatithermus flavus]|uniref:Phosphoribulokinase n=1 Tax=Benzoatithermus flavus TaxID=3108223 RepID=A0ABU8XRZ6_9PROT
MPKNRVVDRPIILGIVGDSAAGKTTLTAGIAAILGQDRVACICSDDYHRYGRKERAERKITALHPDCNYIDILEQHLRLLRQNQPVLKPVYDHRDGSLAAPEYVAPKPYIIVEGLLGYHTRAMRDCYDVKLYLEPEEELRIRWKIQRDMGKRGYTREQVLAQIKDREHDTQAFIRPQRTFADIVISFYPPEDHAEETGSQLNVRHILRPTLPHPDLSPILDRGTNSGLHLELSRDTDGKPVDVLEIRGDIARGRAERLENLLWSLIPEASHLRANVGAFDGSGPQMSHTLALTQLLIAYHMVKAAMGEHAI